MSEEEKNADSTKELTEQPTQERPAPPEDEKTTKKSRRKSADSDKLKTELSALNDRYLRTLAEFDNYRKRTDREKRQSISYGVGNAVEALLPVLDTLSTAAAAECSDPDYKKGVELTISKFESALRSLDIEEIDALGKPFDPALHYAVQKENSEGSETNTILRVLQKGYKLGDRVIRHVMVTVAG